MVKDFPIFADRNKPDPLRQPLMDRTMFFSTGDTWKRIRAVSSPTFTSGKLRKMFPLVNECVDYLLTAFDRCAKGDGEANLKNIFGDLTMDVICRCAFGTQTNTHDDPNNPLVCAAKEFFKPTFKGRARAILFFVMPQFVRNIFYTYSPFRPEVFRTFGTIVNEIVTQRRELNKKGQKRADFLQLLLDTQTEKNGTDKEEIETELDSAESHHVHEDKDLDKDINRNSINSIVRKPLNEIELLAQVFIFLVAGYETTATLLSYLFYSLATNPECQEQLLAEIEKHQDDKGEINYETLVQMPYLDACIQETLRLYTPVVTLNRMPSEDIKIGDQVIPKNMRVNIAVYAVHHNEEFYPNPYRFNPARFLPENREKLVPYTYLPFGAGPRNCIGMRFALVEAKLATVKVLKRYKFSISPNTPIPIEYQPGSGILQAKKNVVKIEFRN